MYLKKIKILHTHTHTELYVETVWLYRGVHSEAVRHFCIVKSQ